MNRCQRHKVFGDYCSIHPAKPKRVKWQNETVELCLCCAEEFTIKFRVSDTVRRIAKQVRQQSKQQAWVQLSLWGTA